MPTQTVTRVVEADIEPERLYHFLAEASNIPQWAPVFADSIEHVSDAQYRVMQYRVMKNGEIFTIEVLLHPSAYAVDYVRQMPGGRRGGAYIRVTPRPLGGSTITMTVPVGPNATGDAAGKILEQELDDVIRLVLAGA